MRAMTSYDTMHNQFLRIAFGGVAAMSAALVLAALH
jgi:hypothetical protein